MVYSFEKLLRAPYIPQFIPTKAKEKRKMTIYEERLYIHVCTMKDEMEREFDINKKSWLSNISSRSRWMVYSGIFGVIISTSAKLFFDLWVFFNYGVI